MTYSCQSFLISCMFNGKVYFRMRPHTKIIYANSERQSNVW